MCQSPDASSPPRKTGASYVGGCVSPSCTVGADLTSDWRGDALFGRASRASWFAPGRRRASPPPGGTCAKLCHLELAHVPPGRGPVGPSLRWTTGVS